GEDGRRARLLRRAPLRTGTDRRTPPGLLRAGGRRRPYGRTPRRRGQVLRLAGKGGSEHPRDRPGLLGTQHLGGDRRCRREPRSPRRAWRLLPLAADTF